MDVVERGYAWQVGQQPNWPANISGPVSINVPRSWHYRHYRRKINIDFAPPQGWQGPSDMMIIRSGAYRIRAGLF